MRFKLETGRLIVVVVELVLLQLTLLQIALVLHLTYVILRLNPPRLIRAQIALLLGDTVRASVNYR